MKHLKMLWLAAIAMAVAMAFTSTAFATVVTSPKGTLYTGTLNGTGTATFHGVVTVSCEAALEGKIESHGASATAKGKGTLWEYTKCGTTTVESITFGTIEVHTTGEGEGTITSSGTTARAVIHSLGLTCSYLTDNTDIGLVTDSSITGGKAIIHLNGEIPRHAGSIFCGSSAEMTGFATVNSPSELFID